MKPKQKPVRGKYAARYAASVPATKQGKEFALDAFRLRRKSNKGIKQIDNSSLPAGSPMYFNCTGCNGSIAVSENYTSRPTLCTECQALKDAGWLEE